MRQKRWVEFLKDYDFTLKYHSGKANIVVDALSRKTLYMASMMLKEYEMLERMRDLKLSMIVSPRSSKMSEVRIERDLEYRIRAFQNSDQFVKKIKD